MRIEINRAECPTPPAEESSCLRCVERYLTEGSRREVHCFRVVEENGSDELTIRIRNYNPGYDDKPLKGASRG